MLGGNGRGKTEEGRKEEMADLAVTQAPNGTFLGRQGVRILEIPLGGRHMLRLRICFI